MVLFSKLHEYIQNDGLVLGGFNEVIDVDMDSYKKKKTTKKPWYIL